MYLQVPLLILLSFFFYYQTLQAQNSRQGGFDYNWSNYTNDNQTGLGSRVIAWDSTDLASIVHAPATGVHPRVYFGPSEMPDILYRMDSTASGQSVKASIKAYATLLNLGSSYNQNSSYARDANNNKYIDNSGAWNMGPFYAALKNQDPTVWNTASIKQRHRTASLMSMEAFYCLFYPHQTDTNVGLSNATRAQLLADAMFFWAKLALNDPTVSPNSNQFNNFGGTHMALCYDLNYNNLSPNQRDTIRLALTKIIPNEPRHGGDMICYANTSNWSTLNSFEIITNLAIEGETGYKPLLTQKWMRALHNFITYGWYPSGAGYEGLGKNYMFVTTLIVGAKRGYSLLAHPHVRAYAEQFLPAITQPFGKGFTSYDVWGGSGYHPSLGQYKFNASDAVGLKWIFPTSNKVDFMWRNYIGSYHRTNSTGYVYAQIDPDDSYNSYLIPAAVFAADYNSNLSWQAQANQVVETDYVAMDRGLAAFKSSKNAQAVGIQFHARQDMGGHTHGDRLDFTMSALGRIWVRKSYGGSPFQPSKFHSMVLIDSLGIGVGDPDGDKCRQPATVLNHTISSDLSSIAADATYPYTWEWHWSPRDSSAQHPWLGNNGWQAVTETWNDFLSTPNPEAHYNTPLYDYPHWHVPNKLERMVKRPYNPMQKVVRNIGLFRGQYPMVLVVDDVQKDNNTHLYQWTAQLARDLEIASTAVHLADSNYQCDLILQEPATTGNRRLLVRILQNENYTNSTPPGFLDTLDYIDFFSGNPYNPNPNWLRQRLIVESNSIAPNFKVLLFPFTQGDTLPITHWNSGRDSLTILFPNETKQLHFYLDSNNNTQFALVPNLLSNPSSTSTAKQALTIFPNPTHHSLTIQSQHVIKAIEVYDTQGRLVQVKRHLNTTHCLLPLQETLSGVYWIRVQLEQGRVITQKVFKF